LIDVELPEAEREERELLIAAQETAESAADQENE